MKQINKKEEIFIYLEGGIIQEINLPNNSNCRIIVRDYDIEGTPEEDLSIDEVGSQYIESIWEN